MSEHPTLDQPRSTGDKKMLISMTAIGVICAFFIVITYQGTLDKIAKNKAEALDRAVYKVLPGISKITPFYVGTEGKLAAKQFGDKPQQKIYAGYDSTGVLKGIAIQGSGKGYGELLSLLYGYDPNTQKLIGFYVLESKETPGIGDKIEKESFLANFKALDVSLTDDHNKIKNPITVVKQGKKSNPWEIDGISGATITSRAVGEIVRTSSEKTLPLIYKNKKILETQNNGQK